MSLRGLYYDNGSSAAQELALSLDEDGILTASPPVFAPVALDELTISSRLGSIPRSISFPSGALIETADHDILDRWLRRHTGRRGWIHALESRLAYALGALMFVVVFVIAGVTWGIPWVSEALAYSLPSRAGALLGEGALESLDKLVFEPAELDAGKQAEWRGTFARLIPADAGGIDYRLEFRDGGPIGPNAFALPDGTVVVTEQLLALAETQEEVISVLLHEIGHVVHRHSLRQIISHSGLAVVTATLMGDLGSAGSLILAMPGVLMEASYTRDLEWEADGYALEQMQRLGYAPGHFADFIERLEWQLFNREAGETDGEKDDGWLNYVSTHPPSRDRVARFRGYTGR